MDNNSQGEVSWSWDFDGDAIIDDTLTYNPSYEYEAIGTYDVTLIVENENGCIDYLTQTLVIVDDEGVYVPNTFSPDGDGINETFYPVFSDPQKEGYEMLIFNRWGEFIWGVYSQATVWDGTYRGVNSPIGTYIWKLKYKDINNNDVELMGHVNLIR